MGVSIKVLVHTAAVRSVMLYGSGIWLFRLDVQRILVFNYYYLHNTSRIWRGNFVSNREVRQKIIGCSF